jgi:transposase
MARADIEEGKKEGLTSDERKELVRLRRDKRRLETENEILRRRRCSLRRSAQNRLPAGP